MTTYTFAVTGMHCVSCGLLIDETLEEEVAGVRQSQTSVRSGRTIVHTDDTVTAQTISVAIAGAGYHASLEATS